MIRDNPLGGTDPDETHEERIARHLEAAIHGEPAPARPPSRSSAPAGGRNVLNIDPDDVTEDDLMAALNDAMAAKRAKSPQGGPRPPSTHEDAPRAGGSVAAPRSSDEEDGAAIRGPGKAQMAELRAKVVALQARVLKADSENEKLQKRLGQMSAETVSYRKRLEERAEQARRQGQCDVFRVLMAAIDSFETALESCQRATDVDTVLQGLNMVLRQILSDMKPLGLTSYEAAGQPFDPNLHEALRSVSEGRVAPGHVAQQLRRGFLLDDKVFRPAMVTVESKD